ncbi:MAG: hypothetical protein LBN21_10400 [Treponema sp.]|jgi:hypothetical protein|nr:hypothetical protein [Treponema sp.]
MFPPYTLKYTIKGQVSSARGASSPVDEPGIIAYHGQMIGFLIKKTFFDLWDNLIKIVLVNLGFIASLAAPVFLPRLCESIPVLYWAVIAIGALWCFVYLAAAALSLKAVSDYGAFSFGDFLGNIKAGAPAGLLLGGLTFILFLMGAVIIPFYINLETIPMVSLLLAAFVFWTMAVCIISLQFFFPIRSRLDTKLSKVFKKCFIIFFDNPGFCVFSFFHNLVLLVLSFFLAFLAPGPAGILLYLDEAMRLRLLKYDWLEANPDNSGGRPKRRKIPWDAILIDDRERTGSRTLRNFIFPWKD